MFLGIAIYTPAWFNIFAIVVALLSIWILVVRIDKVEENKPVPKLMMTAVILHIMLLVLNLGFFAHNMVRQAEVQQLKAQEMAIESVQN